jgi:hypothetical protein
MNSQFLRSTTVGPYPREMQAAWDVLRDEAAANYGLGEGWREEAARERMGPLAERTPARVRNRGADERKRARRGESGIPAGSRQTSARTREEGDGREERETSQEARETGTSKENIDGILQAVAEAISEAEREVAEAKEGPQAETYGPQEASTARGIHEAREANARQLAINVLQSMEGANKDQPEGTTGEGLTRRTGKEPVLGGTQAEYMKTPPEHCPQQTTPPTKAYGGA